MPQKLHGLGLYNTTNSNNDNDDDNDDIDDTIMFTTLSTIPEETSSSLDCSRINGVPGFPDFHWNNTEYNNQKFAAMSMMNNTSLATTAVDWEDQRRLDLIKAAAASDVNDNIDSTDIDYNEDTDYFYSKTNTTRKYHQKQLRKLRMIRIRRNHQQQLRQIVNKHHTRQTGLVKYRYSHQQPKLLPMSSSENNNNVHDHQGDNNDTSTDK